jgi:hypothetical protein
LDAQKFFHDVTYDHRLRDSPHELYQFSKMPSFLTSPDDEDDDDVEEKEIEAEAEENDLPNGVFTLLTDCYSPTCTRDNVCYSIACPRRLEQVFFFVVRNEFILIQSYVIFFLRFAACQS